MNNKKIILLHGWGAGVSKLEPLKKELETSGWDVLLPKLPGFDARDPKRPWELKDYSLYVQKVARKKWRNKKYYIFGHSFGGRVVIKIAKESSDSLYGIILCAVGGISRAHILKRITFFVLAKFGKILMLTPPLVKILRKVLYKVAREHDYEKSNRVMKKTMQKVIKEDLKPLLSNIKVDTLIIWGKLDKLTLYSDALVLKDHLQNSKLICFPDQGHKLPYKLPKEIAKEIDKWII